MVTCIPICLKVASFDDYLFCHLEKLGISEWHVDTLSEYCPSLIWWITCAMFSWTGPHLWCMWCTVLGDETVKHLVEGHISHDINIYLTSDMIWGSSMFLNVAMSAWFIWWGFMKSWCWCCHSILATHISPWRIMICICRTTVGLTGGMYLWAPYVVWTNTRSHGSQDLVCS